MAATIQTSVFLTKDGDFTTHFQPKSAIGSLKFCKNMQELQQFHGQIVKTGLSCVPSAVTNLISVCTEMACFESLSYARKAFEKILEEEEDEANLFMYNYMIRAYSSVGFGDESVSLYLQMVMRGVAPDRFTFPFLISACTKISAFEEGIQAHGSLIKMGLGKDLFVQNSLIHFYAEKGEMDFARKVFDEMPERNVVSWTSLICGYARRDHPVEAVNLFEEMERTGKIRPNSVTMACVISACTKLRDLDLGERICAYIGDLGIGFNAVLVNALVDMYMKCGAVESAKRLFDECTERNLVLWNIMVSNYAHQSLPKKALAIFGEMLCSGLRPDRVTMVAAISASAQLDDSVYGRHFHGYVLRNRLDGWDVVSNSLIDMYMKCNEPEMAFRVFNLMSKKTAASWNTVIAGFLRNGDTSLAWSLFNAMPERDLVSWNTMVGTFVQESWFDEAIELFRVMQSSGVRADKVTMVSVASACGYLGTLDLAKWTHTYIAKHRIPCDIKLGTALVDMYARCGDPGSSMQVFDRMPEKDVSAWTAAIGAMAMEGNGDRAIKLFTKMIEQGVKPDAIAFVGVLTACSHAGLVDEGRQIFQSMNDEHGVSPHIVHYGCMVDLLGRAGLLQEAHDLVKSMPMKPNDMVWGALLAACCLHKDFELANYAAERVTELAPERTGIQVLLSNMYASAGKWADVARVRLQLKDRGVRKIPGSSSIEFNGIFYEFTSGDESHPDMIQITRMLDEIGIKLKHVGHTPDLANVLLAVDEEEKEYVLSRHSEKLAIAFGLIGTQCGIPIRIVKNLRMCSDCHSFAKLVSEIYGREIVIRDNNQFHFFRQGLCSCKDYW